MSLTIDISPEIAKRVQDAADQSNLSVQEYLRRLVEFAVGGDSIQRLQTGADLVRALHANGVIGAWRDRLDAVDSIALADKLRQAAQIRTRG